MKFKQLVYPVLIQPTQIREMREIIETQDTLKVGASVTLAELEETLRYHVKTKPGNALSSNMELDVLDFYERCVCYTYHNIIISIDTQEIM